MHWASLEDAIINGYGSERSFLCHIHGDTNASASVNVDKGVWYCYACHAHGRIDLDDVEYDPDSMLRAVRRIQKALEKSETYLPENWLDIFDAAGPGDYWLSRFSAHMCREHRLGQTIDGQYATIPLRDNTGVVRGVIRRSLRGAGPRYHYPYQAKLSERLYGYHRATQPVIFLTEGATDTIAIDEVAPGYAMAMYGSSLSKSQAHLIARYSPQMVWIATDMDASGDLAAESISRRLFRTAPVARLDWEQYKDLASIPIQERSEMIKWALTSQFASAS